MPANAASGTCKDIAGCGKIENHALTPYQCGTEPGCPSCPQGQSCEDHVCYQRDITAPETGNTGANVTIHATENGGPCRSCDFSITLPNGTIITGKTDQNGDFILPLKLPGTYNIELLHNGVVLKSIKLDALAGTVPVQPPQPQEQPSPVTGMTVIGLLILLLVLALLLTKRKAISEKLGFGKGQEGKKK
jgi:hypothetical protein